MIFGPRGMLFSTFERPSNLGSSGGDAYNAGVTPFSDEKFGSKTASGASSIDPYAFYLDNLNRLKPKSELAVEYLPVLVRFANLNDPTSIELVDPRDLATSFGNGVDLKSVIIEITDDQVTHRIETLLPWLKSRAVDERLFPNPNHQPPPLDQRLVRRLTYDDFRRLPP